MMERTILILDGAMGTMLQKKGLKRGEHSEIFGYEHPDILKSIHKDYIAAGSDVIYTDTFGANARFLLNERYSVSEVVRKNVRTAREAAAEAAAELNKEPAKVALDIGPLGALMEPLGPLAFDDAYGYFKEILKAGEEAGADLVIFETMSDLYEIKAGVLAAKENTSLPVWCTMSFEENGRTFTGTSAASMAMTLDGLGADAIGVNCSLGPDRLMPVLEEINRYTDRPLILKPNAGLPDPATGAYDMKPDEFAALVGKAARFNIGYIGGCCGTTPEFIAALSKVRDQIKKCPADPVRRIFGVCSSSKTVSFGKVNVTGERINPTGKKKLQQALKDKDLDYIMRQAIEQQEAGADILDINVGLPGTDEPEMMEAAVKAVQSVSDLPLQIDSSDVKAIEAGLRAVSGKAIVNSVNGDDDKLAQILPLVRKYGAAVIGLTIDKNGVPEDAQGRFKIAEKIMNAALAAGIKKENIIIDCLALTVSAQQDQASQTLKAVRLVKERLGLPGTLGVSNISFGLPLRNTLTSAFLAQALAEGVEFPIINPNSTQIMDTVYAHRALSGEDSDCAAYIERFAPKEAYLKQAPPAEKSDLPGIKPAGGKDASLYDATENALEDAIIKGLAGETETQTLRLLEQMSGMDIINMRLIPALDIVGEKYEKGEIFLPQLLNSANAACAGLELVKARLKESGSQTASKGKIIMATVEGDIHDIGKNIVKVVLENYGYQVIDLGKDVPARKVVDTAIKEDVKLIGLSALMTTTVESMARTIKALKESGHRCQTFVGGAVLTPEYAKEIGADFYAKDAKESADIAKSVLG